MEDNEGEEYNALWDDDYRYMDEIMDRLDRLDIDNQEFSDE